MVKKKKEDMPIFKRRKRKTRKIIVKKKSEPKKGKVANSKRSTKKYKKSSILVTRTLSHWGSFDKKNLNILRFLSHEAKNVYNCSIFHSRIFYRYSKIIYEIMYGMITSGEIKTIKELDDNFYSLYHEYYIWYVSIKDHLMHNNMIIYQFIQIHLEDVCIVNDNYDYYCDEIIDILRAHPQVRFGNDDDSPRKIEVVDNIVRSILQSFYNRNYALTAEEIENGEECTISDETFIEQVRKKHIFLTRFVKKLITRT